MLQTKRFLMAGLLLASLVSLPSWAETSTSAEVPTATPVTAAGLPQLTQLIKQNSAAVVNISVEGKQENIFSGFQHGLPPELERFFRGLPEMQPDRGARATGSGFILSSDGYVITNAHVIEDAEKVTVSLSDRRELVAEVVGMDKLSDIALLKLDADQLPAVELGNSDGLEVGQWVFAIGAPFGLDHTATQGIVSALSRSLPDGTYVPFIQTDVAVNPGNSGGPLFDLNGRVIGVNSQIYSRSGGYMGISFAIPINVAKNVVEQIKSSGQVSRGWLGVQIQDMDQNLASSFNLDQPRGALVASVQSGGPADKAGIQAGDIIVNFAGGEVKSASDLPLLVGNTAVGSQVDVKVLRANEEKVLNVEIAQLAENDAVASEQFAMDKSDKATLGLMVAELSAEERKANKVEQGVLVQKILPDSPAQQAGLSSGDIIISVNNQTIDSIATLKNIIKAAPSGKPLAMLVMQGENSRFVAVKKP